MLLISLGRESEYELGSQLDIPILQDCPVYQRVDGHPVARGYVAGAPNGDGRILVHGPKSESPVFGLTYWVVIKLSSVSS